MKELTIHWSDDDADESLLNILNVHSLLGDF